MGKFDFMKEELNRLKESGLYNQIRTLNSPQGAWVVVDGKKVLNMCSNDYLGFANHPKLVERAREILDKYGVGPGAVRSIAGTMDIHLELEEKLAKFKQMPAVLSLQSGFTANLATIPAVAGDPESAILTDELNHASIIDGCRLTKAKRFIYKHNDVEDLKAKLEEAKNFKKILIVTDGVFSMDGDIAPLKEIVELAEDYDAMTYVDDAHGEGVLGDHGRGVAHHLGVHGKVDFEIGTMSKAFGVVGGYVASNELAIEFLRQKARPFLFSSAVTPPDVAACIAAVELLMETDKYVKKLWDNANYFKKEMQSLGFDTGKSQTPITPIMLGEAKLAREFSKKLYDEGLFAMAIGYPTVPKGKARIRVMISATHSKEDLDFALRAFEKVGKELKVI